MRYALYASAAVLAAIGAYAFDLPPIPELPPLPSVGGSVSEEGINVTVGNRSFSANFSGVNTSEIERMLPHVEVDDRIAAFIKANLDGWVQFCPNSLIPRTNDPNDDCTSFRPVSFFETYANGGIVSDFLSGGLVQLTNLYSALHIADIANVTMPSCEQLPDESYACGATVNGEPLNYTLQPLWIPLLNGGELHLDAWTFQNEGVLSFGGNNYTVTPGMAKFDVRLVNYSFQSMGDAVHLELSSKTQGHEQNDIVVANTSTGDVWVNGQILYLPRYAVKTAIDAADWVWKTAVVTRIVRGDEVFTRLTFEGPFVSLSYDPLIASVSASGSASTDGGVGNAQLQIVSSAGAVAVTAAAFAAILTALL